MRKESLTEYAYFIFCNCLPYPTNKRQEGSIKLLRKKFPLLYIRVSHDLSACQNKGAPITGTSRKQEFGMCELETALEQYCARNGFDGLPYTAAASAIAAHLKKTQSAVANSLSVELGGKCIDLGGELGKLSGETNNAMEMSKKCSELPPGDIPACNSQTESFLIRTDASASSEEVPDKPLDTSLPEEVDNVPLDTSLPEEGESVPLDTSNPQEIEIVPLDSSNPEEGDSVDRKDKVVCFATSVVSYDADMSSETDTFCSSTPLHENIKKKVKQMEPKKQTGTKKTNWN